jgi:hypothetical protein
MAGPDLDHDDIALSDADREAVRNNGRISIGRVQMQIDNDIVSIRTAEGLKMHQLVYQLRVFEEILKLRGRFYILAWHTQSGFTLPAEQRRYLAKWTRTHSCHGVASIHNGNRLAVIVTSLLFRGISAVYNQSIPFEFFQTETDARAWLDNLRQKR